MLLLVSFVLIAASQINFARLSPYNKEGYACGLFPYWGRFAVKMEPISNARVYFTYNSKYSKSFLSSNLYGIHIYRSIYNQQVLSPLYKSDIHGTFVQTFASNEMSGKENRITNPGSDLDVSIDSNSGEFLRRNKKIESDFFKQKKNNLFSLITVHSTLLSVLEHQLNGVYNPSDRQILYISFADLPRRGAHFDVGSLVHFDRSFIDFLGLNAQIQHFMIFDTLVCGNLTNVFSTFETKALQFIRFSAEFIFDFHHCLDKNKNTVINRSKYNRSKLT